MTVGWNTPLFSKNISCCEPILIILPVTIVFTCCHVSSCQISKHILSQYLWTISNILSIWLTSGLYCSGRLWSGQTAGLRWVLMLRLSLSPFLPEAPPTPSQLWNIQNHCCICQSFAFPLVQMTFCYRISSGHLDKCNTTLTICHMRAELLLSLDEAQPAVI